MEYYPSLPMLGGHVAYPADATSGKAAAAAQGAPVAIRAPAAQPALLAEEVHHLVQDLRRPERREQSLLELSKRRETFADMAPILWYSFGTVVILIQEIVCIYPQLSPPPTLTAHASNRVCNSLALLQCVATHSETRPLFLKAHIPLLLYPFLNTVSRDRPFEYLRLTSLGVIGALVKVDDAEVISFLLQTEIIPLCLRIMETGSELSKTVATFIVQKLLLDDAGLSYMCLTADRFFAVSSVLAKMVATLQQTPSVRLLKNVIKCYLRLSENPRAREALRTCLPECLQVDPMLHADAIANCLREDRVLRQMHAELMQNLGVRTRAQQPLHGPGTR